MHRSEILGYGCMHAAAPPRIAFTLRFPGRAARDVSTPGRAPGQLRDASALLASVAQRGDRAAFALLFDFYAPRIKTYLVRVGVDRARAEELTQEAMLAVWRKAAQFDPSRADASAWIYAIARNLRVDQARRENRPALAAEFAHVAEPEPQPDQRLSALQWAAKLRAAISELPPDQTEALRAVYFEDQAHAEAAVALDLPLGTLKSRVRLALQRLRASLEAQQ